MILSLIEWNYLLKGRERFGVELGKACGEKSLKMLSFDSNPLTNKVV